MWFDDKGYMSPYGENGVLFTSEYLHLNSDFYVQMHMKNAIEAALVDYNDFLSHDNWTGIVCASKLLGLSYHKNLFARDFWRRLHPRDIGFYLYLKFDFKVFLIPTILAMLWACYSKQQTNGTLDTDGKILAWLRLHHIKIPLLNKLLENILLSRHNATWYDIFLIYFKDTEHPILKELYGRSR